MNKYDACLAVHAIGGMSIFIWLFLMWGGFPPYMLIFVFGYLVGFACLAALSARDEIENKKEPDHD